MTYQSEVLADSPTGYWPSGENYGAQTYSQRILADMAAINGHYWRLQEATSFGRRLRDLMAAADQHMHLPLHFRTSAERNWLELAKQRGADHIYLYSSITADEVGANHGTATDITTRPALSFNGSVAADLTLVTSRIDIPDSATINTAIITSYSFECMVRPDTFKVFNPTNTVGVDTIWEQGGSVQGLSFYFYDNGTADVLTLNVWDDNWSTVMQSLSYTFPARIKKASPAYHVAFTFSIAPAPQSEITQKLYVNGEVRASRTAAIGQDDLDAHTGNCAIGNAAGGLTNEFKYHDNTVNVGNDAFDGRISNVAIYHNQLLDEETVRRHYFEAASGMPYGQGAKNYATIHEPGRTGFSVDAAHPSGAAGRRALSWSSQGNTGLVHVSKALAGSFSQLTVGFWVQLISVPTTTSTILSWGDTTYFRINVTTAGLVEIYLAFEGGGWTNYGTSTVDGTFADLSDLAAHFIVLQWSVTNGLQFWNNGTLRTSGTNAGSKIGTGVTRYGLIGGDNNSASPILGTGDVGNVPAMTIADVFMWVSSAEANLLTTTDVNNLRTESNRDAADSKGTSTALHVKGDPLVGGASAPVLGRPGPLHGDAGSVAVQPDPAGAVIVPGPPPFSPSSPFCLEFWFSPVAVGIGDAANHPLVALYEKLGRGAPLLVYALTSPLELRTSISTTAFGADTSLLGAGVVPLVNGSWYHYVLNYDFDVANPGSWEIYVNNVLKASGISGAALYGATVPDLMFGAARIGTTWYFADFDIAEVAVYESARMSAATVKDHYYLGKKMRADAAGSNHLVGGRPSENEAPAFIATGALPPAEDDGAANYA